MFITPWKFTDFKESLFVIVNMYFVNLLNIKLWLRSIYKLKEFIKKKKKMTMHTKSPTYIQTLILELDDNFEKLRVRDVLCTILTSYLVLHFINVNIDFDINMLYTISSISSQLVFDIYIIKLTMNNLDMLSNILIYIFSKYVGLS